MTEIPITICPECESAIEEFGAPCMAIIYTTCAYYRNLKPIKIIDDHAPIHPPARFLESKGYIVTTEVSEAEITMLPNWKKCFWNPQDESFCWCNKMFGV